MPSRFLHNCKIYLEIGCYIGLLCFMVPIRIDNEYKVREQFLNYLEKFNKSYPDDDDTFNLRFFAFKNSLANINSLNINRTNISALYGLTKFSDLSPEEFKSFLKNFPAALKDKSSKFNNTITKRSTYWETLPMKVDWREKRAVSKVKYQKDCGACWAFAVMETIESAQAIKTHSLTELSVQQMIDCSTYTDGCNGGDTCSLLRWIKDNNIAIATEAEYPLTFKDEKCKNISAADGVRIKSFICEGFVGQENIILKLLATSGPVTVGINGQTWQNYVGGVIQFHCDGGLSHAVQIVGYDLTAKVPYYIIRNSWGEDFGDNGYLYVAIGSNVCGVAYEVAAVTVA